MTKVIVPTVVIYFFFKVSQYEIHVNKCKNTFHKQQID